MNIINEMSFCAVQLVLLEDHLFDLLQEIHHMKTRNLMHEEERYNYLKGKEKFLKMKISIIKEYVQQLAEDEEREIDYLMKQARFEIQ